MNRIPYLLFIVVFFVPFLTKNRSVVIFPRTFSLIFELVSVLIITAAIIYATTKKDISVQARYILLFAILCLHFVIGGVVNGESTSVFFSGVRDYLKYLPMFILPLVYRYSEGQIKIQLIFLVALALIQFPFVLIEKFLLSWEPDIVAGTLVTGSIMSIYLICCIVLMAGFYFRGFVSGRKFLFLSVLLFAPATLNESKASMFLMMLGLVSIMFISRIKKSQIVTGVSVIVVMLVAFTFVYDRFFDTAGEEGLLSFYMNSDSGVVHYLYSGDSVEIDPKGVLEQSKGVIGALPTVDADSDKIRRLDAIILPLRVLSQDPIKLIFGLGIANTSSSSVDIFSGQYSYLGNLTASLPALPRLLWEIGVLGVGIYLIFFCFICYDSYQLAKNNNFNAALSLGWFGVTIIIILSLPYKNFMLHEALGALFWYFSGHVVASRYRSGV